MIDICHAKGEVFYCSSFVDLRQQDVEQNLAYQVLRLLLRLHQHLHFKIETNQVLRECSEGIRFCFTHQSVQILIAAINSRQLGADNKKQDVASCYLRLVDIPRKHEAVTASKGRLGNLSQTSHTPINVHHAVSGLYLYESWERLSGQPLTTLNSLFIS